MAKSLWGKVFIGDTYAGILEERPGDVYHFTYDSSYIENISIPIGVSLPIQKEPHISFNGLHSFFDNLVAEGWLEKAQSRLLGKRQVTRFELLLAFGYDCHGAVYVIDPEPETLSNNLLDIENDFREMALSRSRASLSGVQPKLAAIKTDNGYRTAEAGELSTYIAKFGSSNHENIVYIEYLTMLAFKALLPKEEIADIRIDSLIGYNKPVLLVKRFDREEHERVHFEEFCQILNINAKGKYDFAYKDMADFILSKHYCIRAEAYRLYSRIITGLLLGNTDMHLKNFAMFHRKEGLRLTPSYDQVAASIYKQYDRIALAITNSPNMQINQLQAKNIIGLAREFQLNDKSIKLAVTQIEKNLIKAKDAISSAEKPSGIDGADIIKSNLIKLMEKRWNGTFALIGKHL